MTEHIGNHLPNGLKREMEFEDVQQEVGALAFTAVDCAANLDAFHEKEESMYDHFSGSESSHDPVDFKRSQYSDDGQDPSETSNIIKEEAVDSFDG